MGVFVVYKRGYCDFPKVLADSNSQNVSPRCLVSIKLRISKLLL
jgi:hypothetical protein